MVAARRLLLAARLQADHRGRHWDRGDDGGTAAAVITGNTVAFDGTRNKIEFFCPALAAAGAIGTVTFVLLRDSTVIGQSNSAMAGASDGRSVKIEAFDTPSAASHTYAVKAFVNTSTLTVKAGAGGAGAPLPAFLRVTKA